MNIQQKKASLINWIENVNDSSLIDKMVSFKELLGATNSDWWQEIPDSHKLSITKGLEEAENGTVISLEAFRKLYAKRI